MINFEDIIDFLAQKGVKSLHIEMHDSKLLNEEKEGLNRRFDELRKREGAPQTFLVDGKLVSATALTEYEITEIRTAIAKATLSANRERIVKTETVNNLKDRRTSEEKLCDEGIEKAIPSPIDPFVSGNEKKTGISEVRTETKPDATAEKPLVTPSATPQKPYEAFCDLVSKDDGSVTKEQRLELISKMGLDDLLRINNDFQLGLDTDKPTEDIRADVAECF